MMNGGGSSFLFRKAFSPSCERGTEGVVTDRVRSESSRSGQALCWPSIAEVPLQALKSAVAVVLLRRGGGCRFHKGKVHLLVLGKNCKVSM